jgi:hypothetical protein
MAFLPETPSRPAVAGSELPPARSEYSESDSRNSRKSPAPVGSFPLKTMTFLPETPSKPAVAGSELPHAGGSPAGLGKYRQHPTENRANLYHNVSKCQAGAPQTNASRTFGPVDFGWFPKAVPVHLGAVALRRPFHTFSVFSPKRPNLSASFSDGPPRLPTAHCPPITAAPPPTTLELSAGTAELARGL